MRTLKLQSQGFRFTMPVAPIEDTFIADLLKARHRQHGVHVDWFDEPQEYEDMTDDLLFRDRQLSMVMGGYDAAICVAALKWIPFALRRLKHMDGRNEKLQRMLDERSGEVAALRRELDKRKNITPKVLDDQP